MTFRHTLGKVQFPGHLIRERLSECFVEVFAPQTEGDSLLNTEDDTTPPTLAESTIEATPGAEETSVTLTFSFYDT